MRVEGMRIGDDRGFHRRWRPDYAWDSAGDEWNAISLNYERHHRQLKASSTTMRRSADVLRQYHRHRHGSACGVSVDATSVPLQRLVLPWSLSVAAGTHVCLRPVGEADGDAIADHEVTHLSGHPSSCRPCSTPRKKRD
jgi:fatty-acyl-CoA synthase